MASLLVIFSCYTWVEWIYIYIFLNSYIYTQLHTYINYTKQSRQTHPEYLRLAMLVPTAEKDNLIKSADFLRI